MNHKIKIMNKTAAISDEEIRGFMDFDGLVLQAGRITYWTKVLSNVRWIAGGSIVAVSVSVFLFWVSQGDTVSPADHSPAAGQAIPEPSGKVQVVDSVIQLKNIPEQTLPSLSVQPKKTAVAARQKETKDRQTEPTTPATVVYREAEPIEGFAHLYEYFSTELKYPEEAVRDSLQGSVTVTFIINSKGQIGEIAVLNSLGPLFDAEAIRLVNHMPAWKPATINDKPVPSKFSLPLTFNFER